MLHNQWSLKAATALLMVGLAACAAGGPSEVLTITSEPTGAGAALSNGFSCVTPCSTALPRDESVVIVYSKEGCESQIINVKWSRGQAVMLINPLFVRTEPFPNPAHAELNCG